MGEIEVKNFDSPDETRPFSGNGQVEVVEIGGRKVMKATYEPGWRWSDNVKPIAQTDSCQVAHFGYVISGAMRVMADDGSAAEVHKGDIAAIAPGHDAEVIGDEPCVMVDFGEIGKFAKAG